MARSENDIRQQKHIGDLHERGRSDKGAHTARHLLGKFDSQHFTDFTQAENIDEYARLLVVCATSAARRLSPALAKEYLDMATTTILKSYPMATTESEASLRNKYWESVYGELNAQERCLVDVIKLLDVVAPILFHQGQEQILQYRMQLAQLVEPELQPMLHRSIGQRLQSAFWSADIKKRGLPFDPKFYLKLTELDYVGLGPDKVAKLNEV